MRRPQASRKQSEQVSPVSPLFKATKDHSALCPRWISAQDPLNTSKRRYKSEGLFEPIFDLSVA